MDYFGGARPRVFGHRGAAGVAPENTLASFALASALGAEYLELDVHATRDGTVVVLHDPTLDRTTEGCGPVRECSDSGLARLDAGHRFTTDGRTFPYRGQGVRVPTLESVLSAFPTHRFNVEIKQESTANVDTVLDVIERTGCRERVLLAAAEDTIMAAIRGAVGSPMPTGMSAGDAAQFFARLQGGEWADYTAPGHALQIPPSHAGLDLVTPESVAAAHQQRLEVHVWTINDAEEIERLLDLQVDGIMSDLPGLVATAIRRRNKHATTQG